MLARFEALREWLTAGSVLCVYGVGEKYEQLDKLEKRLKLAPRPISSDEKDAYRGWRVPELAKRNAGLPQTMYSPDVYGSNYAQVLRPLLGPGARTVLRNFGPVFVGRGVVQISAYVDMSIVSLLGVGATAALGYAQQLYLLPVALILLTLSCDLKAIARDKSRPMEERFAATLKLAQMPRNSSATRVRNRCELTGRPRQQGNLVSRKVRAPQGKVVGNTHPG